MTKRTKIEWTDYTCNPMHGCTPAEGSELKACMNCYARRFSGRHIGVWKDKPFDEPELALDWKKRLAPAFDSHNPEARVFVGSMTDMFHKAFPFRVIDEVLGELTHSRAKIILLTKRAQRMAEFTHVYNYQQYANFWWGVTAEDQEAYDERVPALLRAKVQNKWVSMEPWLSPVFPHRVKELSWIVCGGENGPKARPWDPHEMAAIAAYAEANDVPVFFKTPGAGSMPTADWSDLEQYKHFPAEMLRKERLNNTGGSGRRKR